MEMSQVRYFLALCDERNFTRAARRCGVAQPSLTQAIKALEAELGGSLFHRHRRGAELSEFGARLEPYFATIWQCAQEIRRAQPSNGALECEAVAPVADAIRLPTG